MRHVDAKLIVDSLGLSLAESLFVRAVGSAEGGYGGGWANNPVGTLGAQMGLNGSEGVGSNNWGAIQGTGDAGFFMHLDHDAAGKEYVAKYKRYSSPQKGAADLARQLLKPAVRLALQTGDLQGAVSEQINTYHYTGDPPATPADVYYSRVSRAVRDIIAATGEPNPFLAHQTPVATGSASVLLASRSLLSAADCSRLNDLRRGVGGPDVAFVQHRLGNCGRIDGSFGPLTEAGVRAFQREKSIPVTGIVDRVTWEAMR